MNQSAPPAEPVQFRSRRHGVRVFTLIGRRPYRRIDGTETTLIEWETPCVKCGTPFSILASARVTPRKDTSPFQTVHCPKDRRAWRSAAPRTSA
jgi:hypothetical protein